jgi:hypothetical protein
VKLAAVSSESGHRRAETALIESTPASSTDASSTVSNLPSVGQIDADNVIRQSQSLFVTDASYRT